MSKTRPLKPEETLDWHDLFRRLARDLPRIDAMLFDIKEWREQRARFKKLYHNLDSNAEGRVTNKDVQQNMKNARKRWKMKH